MTRLLCLFLLLAVTCLPAQDRKPPVKDQPRVLVSLPLGVEPGKPARIVLRGLKLETAKEIRLSPGGTAKVLNKGSATVPNQQEADRVGNSSVEVEVNIPGDVGGETAELVVVTPAGESTPHRLLLDRTAVVAEKEPNDGFKQAQKVELGQTVQGSINRSQDVDVCRFEGKAGQKVLLEVFASRHGSALDSFLTLYNEDGQILATNDDVGSSTDSRIETTLPKNGSYLVGVGDAHDQGGPAHVYRLVIRQR